MGGGCNIVQIGIDERGGVRAQGLRTLKYPAAPSTRSKRRNSTPIEPRICCDVEIAVLRSLQTQAGNPERGLTTKFKNTPQCTGGGCNGPPSATHTRNEDGTRYLIPPVFYGNKGEYGAQKFIRKSVYWGSDVARVTEEIKDFVEWVEFLKDGCEYLLEL